METSKVKSELDLFFESICKTVEKLGALDQAMVKMGILKIVNQAEIAFIKSIEVLSFELGSDDVIG